MKGEMDRIPELKNGEQKVFFRAGGEWCYLWTPSDFRMDSPVPVVIHHHGARGYVKDGSADWLDDDSKASILRAVMSGGGCAVAGSHACGDHWGNPQSVQANWSLFKALTANRSIDSNRVALMGGGLGGALIWNSVLGPMSGRVKAAAVLQAVSSLEGVVRDHKFKAPLLVAYGLPADTGDDKAVEKVKESDPMPRLQRLPRGTPLPRTAVYHGAVDENIPPHLHAKPLSEALEKAGGEVTLELIPGVGHAVYAMGPQIERRLKDFFSKYL